MSQGILFALELEPSNGDDPTKRCSWCEKILPLDSFSPDRIYSQGVRHACRRCERNHNKIISVCRDSGQFASLFQEQKGQCGICHEKEAMHGRQSSLCIDVDHRAMNIRGLLCRTCNIMLGRLEKVDPVLLYLRRAQERNR